MFTRMNRAGEAGRLDIVALWCMALATMITVGAIGVFAVVLELMLAIGWVQQTKPVHVWALTGVIGMTWASLFMLMLGLWFGENQDVMSRLRK